MSIAMLLSLLPLIEAVLKEAPTIIGDVEAIIARVKGGTANSITPDDAAKIMSALDADLSRWR